MTPRRERKPRPPLDPPGLQDLAISYVGRFGTTRARLAQYLRRKLRERGWAGPGEPAIEVIVERIARLGYVDDAAFAMAKARSLGARGYGAGRLRQALAAAGVDEADSGAARERAADNRVRDALALARRRRFGPFSSEIPDPRTREKWIAAMVRAGHAFGLARAITALPPGSEPDEEALAEQNR